MSISTKALREAIMARFVLDDLTLIAADLKVTPNKVFKTNTTFDIQVYDLLAYFARHNSIHQLLEELRKARPTDEVFQNLTKAFEAQVQAADEDLVDIFEKEAPDRAFREVRFKRRLITFAMGLGCGLFLVATLALTLPFLLPSKITADAGWHVWKTFRDEEARLVKIAPHGGTLYPAPLSGVSLHYFEKGKRTATAVELGEDGEFRIPFDKLHPDYGYIKLVVDPAALNSTVVENPVLVLDAIKYDQPNRIWLLGSIKSIPIGRTGSRQ